MADQVGWWNREARPQDGPTVPWHRWGTYLDQMRLCFALALWNEADETLKERLFSLSGPEGNHGEDVTEYYFLGRYARGLYKYLT